MAQVTLQVCGRCGADFDPEEWVQGADAKWCHPCPDGVTGGVVEIDSENYRPRLVDAISGTARNGWPYDGMAMADGVLAGWSSRGFSVEMSTQAGEAPKFVPTVGTTSNDRFALLHSPPNADDAEILLDLEEHIRGVLAARGLLRLGSGGKKSIGIAATDIRAGGHGEVRVGLPVVAGVPKNNGSGVGALAPAEPACPQRILEAVDFDAAPRYQALGYAGILEAVSDPTTIPPITACPSCRGTVICRFWEQPLLLKDADGEVEVPVIYHCTLCLRDDLYGLAVGTNGSMHKSKLVYPHIGTCWPDANYNPNKFRSPTKAILLASIAAADLELDTTGDSHVSD